MAGGKVHLHSLLACHGGAARVKQLLAAELQGLGWQVSITSEISDWPPEAQTSETNLSPAEMASVDSGALFHLHTTKDWPAACTALAQRQASSEFRTIVTLHDLSFFTGGCPNPLDCTGLSEGCVEACPQGYKNAPAVQACRIDALRKLNPALAAPSNWLARQVKRALPCVSCRLIPNGVEDNPLSKARAREMLGVAQEALVVLFVAHGGVLSGLKGAGQWKAIWGSLKAKVPNALGFMVGGEKERREADLIEWPYVGHGHLQILMAAANLLVYPSLADNHPLVVLEAMSASTAVCAYGVGGIPEQVRDGETGVLVAPQAEESLVQACAEVLLAPGLSRTLGKNGRSVYERHFKVSDMAGKYQDMYSDIMAEGRP